MCWTYVRSHFKVTWFTLHFVSTLQLLNPSNDFSKLHQMFFRVMRCAELLSQQCRLKVTLQCHGIYPWISCPFPSPKPFARFSLNVTQMFFSVSWLQNPLLSYANPKSRPQFKVMGDFGRGISLFFRLLSCSSGFVLIFKFLLIFMNMKMR